MNKFRIHPFLAAMFSIVLLLSACEEDDINPIGESCEESDIVVTPNPSYSSSGAAYQNSILILNEGGFSMGTASLSALDGSLTNGVFSSENGYALGDILQSATVYGEDLYLVVNNSQKIEVLNRNNLSVKRTITGFGSPRFMAFSDGKTAAVTDLYANKIILIDTEEGCMKDSFNTNGWTEQIEYVNGKFYAIERNNWGEADFANVLVFSNGLSLEVSIPVALEANSLVVDDNNNVWVLSAGKDTENVKPTLTKINTSTDAISMALEFPLFTDAADNLAFDAQGDNLYFNIGADIYKMSVSSTVLPTSASYTSGAAYVYDVAISPTDGKVYVSDAKDFVSTGEVFVYDAAGALETSYSTGVIPTGVVFP